MIKLELTYAKLTLNRSRMLKTSTPVTLSWYNASPSKRSIVHIAKRTLKIRPTAKHTWKTYNDNSYKIFRKTVFSADIAQSQPMVSPYRCQWEDGDPKPILLVFSRLR